MSINGDSLPDVLTAKEVAEYLRMPQSTVYYLAKSGGLPCFRVGGRWRFRREDLLAVRSSSPKPCSVLVVDDDELVCQMLSDVLSEVGYEVTTACGVDEALALTRQRRFDAFLIDLVLGDRRGIEVIRELQNDYSLRQMVVIAGRSELLDTAPLLELGAITVLRKPFSTSQVIECLDQIVAHPPRAAGR